MPLVFAYGSNLLRERLVTRCPSAVSAGRAVLAGHRLTFDKISKDGSGKCAFEKAVNAIVHGVLWQIADGDMGELDRLEGLGTGYERSSASVTSGDGDHCDALAYSATNTRAGMLPYDWYLALVLAGAMQQAIPAGYIDALRRQPFLIDDHTARLSRLAAIKALEMAGMLWVKDELTRGEHSSRLPFPPDA